LGISFYQLDPSSTGTLSLLNSKTKIRLGNINQKLCSVQHQQSLTLIHTFLVFIKIKILEKLKRQKWKVHFANNQMSRASSSNVLARAKKQIDMKIAARDNGMRYRG
jgi:hypothetical protein